MSSLHANCILIGSKGLLIKGASGTGKSHLCWQLLNDPSLFTRLISDDRTVLTVYNARLIAEAPKTIQGKIELRQHGIITLPYEPKALVGFVLELGDNQAPRMPHMTTTEIQGLTLPFWQIPPNFDSFNFVKSLINLDLLK